MARIYSVILAFFFATSQLLATGLPVPFKLYPNPLTGETLQVNFEADAKQGQTYQFVITNVIGQVVYKHMLTDEEVRRGSFSIRTDEIKLEKGVYLTKMVHGDQSSVQKLVVR